MFECFRVDDGKRGPVGIPRNEILIIKALQDIHELCAEKSGKEQRRAEGRWWISMTAYWPNEVVRKQLTFTYFQRKLDSLCSDALPFLACHPREGKDHTFGWVVGHGEFGYKKNVSKTKVPCLGSTAARHAVFKVLVRHCAAADAIVLVSRTPQCDNSWDFCLLRRVSIRHPPSFQSREAGIKRDFCPVSHTLL